jgi:hypothetical protein
MTLLPDRDETIPSHLHDMEREPEQPEQPEPHVIRYKGAERVRELRSRYGTSDFSRVSRFKPRDEGTSTMRYLLAGGDPATPGDYFSEPYLVKALGPPGLERTWAGVDLRCTDGRNLYASYVAPIDNWRAYVATDRSIDREQPPSNGRTPAYYGFDPAHVGWSTGERR